MFSDTIPIPSMGLFYEGTPEYLEVFYLTTEDELMMTSPNLFNKGDVLYKLLENKVCKHNNINVDDLLVNDKNFILLWLRENAFGNIIEYDETTKDKKEKFFFDTHNISIKNIDKFPDDGNLYTLRFQKHELKFKLLTVADEKKYKNHSKLDYYISHIHSLDGDTDRDKIKTFIHTLPILEGRKIKRYIDSINFGVGKTTTCYINDKPVKTNINMDEIFFGYSQENLAKINKSIKKSMFFLMNEGQGYNNNDLLKMTTFDRKFNEDELIAKIHKMNEQIKQK